MSSHAIELIPVRDGATRQAAESLIREYLGWIAAEAAQRYGLAFDVEAMVASDLHDAAKFYAPHGRFYLAPQDGMPVGVGCLKRLPASAAEIQRMYVRPACRGSGLGRRLLERLLADCADMGCEVVRLESLRFLSAAHALYRNAGFVEVPPYDDSSMQDYQSASARARYLESVVFMERRL